MSAAIVNNMDLVRQLYAPNAATMLENLPAMGQSLSDACIALADDCTLPRIDELVARLQTAQQSLTQLRLILIEREIEQHGTGIKAYQQEQTG